MIGPGALGRRHHFRSELSSQSMRRRQDHVQQHIVLRLDEPRTSQDADLNRSQPARRPRAPIGIDGHDIDRRVAEAPRYYARRPRILDLVVLSSAYNEVVRTPRSLVYASAPMD